VKRKVTVYLTDDELRGLRKEAARRRISLSRHLKESVIAPGIEENGSVAYAETPGAEKRLADAVRNAASAGNRSILEQLGTLIVMLDQFVLTVLIHTPEISEAQKERALDAGEARHRGWQQKVQGLLRQLRADTARENQSVAANGARA
jgi:hypothetical protein